MSCTSEFSTDPARKSCRLYVGAGNIEVVATLRGYSDPNEQLRLIHRALQLAGIEVTREMARLRDAERKNGGHG